jgi:stromal membrane-associated protein
LNVFCNSGIGAIEFIGVLVVKIISAKDLVNADIIGKSDPYVVAQLGKQILKSKVIQNDLNPVWNETLMFSWTGSDDLLLEVYDEDLTNEDGKYSV